MNPPRVAGSAAGFTAIGDRDPTTPSLLGDRSARSGDPLRALRTCAPQSASMASPRPSSGRGEGPRRAHLREAEQDLAGRPAR
jgi:hypothetical protein